MRAGLWELFLTRLETCDDHGPASVVKGDLRVIVMPYAAIDAVQRDVPVGTGARKQHDVPPPIRGDLLVDLRRGANGAAPGRERLRHIITDRLVFLEHAGK